jgi:hypothetical protein
MNSGNWLGYALFATAAWGVWGAFTGVPSEHSGGTLPLALLSQYLPIQYAAIREGRLANEARAILLDGVAHVLRQYARACRPGADVDHDGVCGE